MFNRSKKKESTDPAPAEAVSSVAAAPVTSGAEISTEIIAVITAAVAALMSGESVGANGFVVRKISRIHGEKVSWSNAGLMECIDSRKI
ncbi:MAG TPA: hypothetical protein VM577_08960 [Anaerovoracaceae bacterium]|nr:hypothetical protein [Anaerovoracaceae bacterium]